MRSSRRTPFTVRLCSALSDRVSRNSFALTSIDLAPAGLVHPIKPTEVVSEAASRRVNQAPKYVRRFIMGLYKAEIIVFGKPHFGRLLSSFLNPSQY